MSILAIGIDCGLSGGVAAIRQRLVGTETVCKQAMPVRPHYTGKGNEVDFPALLQWLGKVTGNAELGAPSIVVIERVGNMRRAGVKMGATSMFTFGDGFGLVRGAVMALPIVPRIEYPLPQTWQKSIFAGMNKGDTKRTALSFVSRRFPEVTLQKSDRAVKPHEGIVDALCLAEYGLRLLQGASQA